MATSTLFRTGAAAGIVLCHIVHPQHPPSPHGDVHPIPIQSTDTNGGVVNRSNGLIAARSGDTASGTTSENASYTDMQGYENYVSRTYDTVFTIDSLGQGEAMPECVECPEPTYPVEAVKREIEGTVSCTILIDENGMVENVEIVHGVDPLLDSSVSRAVRRFAFIPARIGGGNAASLIQYEKSFSIAALLSHIPRYENISGVLFDEILKTPLAGASVALGLPDTAADTSLVVPFHRYRDWIGSLQGQRIENGSLITATDSLGAFAFHSIPAGPVELFFYHPGYDTLTVVDSLTHHEALRLSCAMHPAGRSPYEILVYGRIPERNTIMDRRTLSAQEVKTLAGSSGCAIKAVQALPGVLKPTMGGPDIFIRGSDTYDSKYYLDGIEIPVLFHYGFKSTYHSDAVKSVALHPGGFGVRYGDAIGGVVEITGRHAGSDSGRCDKSAGRIHGTGDANLLDVSLTAEKSLGENTAMFAAARRSFLGEILSTATRSVSDAVVMTMAPYYWDYVMRFDHTINARNNVWVTFFGVDERLKLVANDIRSGNNEIDKLKCRLDYETLFHMILLGWNRRLSSRVSNTLRIAGVYSRGHIGGVAGIANDCRYESTYLREQCTCRLSSRLAMDIGADIEVIPATVSIRSQTEHENGTAFYPKRRTMGDIAGYAQGTWNPTDRIDFIAGIRYDYYPELNAPGSWLPAFADYTFIKNTTRISGDPSLRIALNYHPAKGHCLKAAVGNYNQTPSKINTPLYRWNRYTAFPASRAVHYCGGYGWHVTDVSSVDIQTYFNKQWRLPRLSNAAEITGGAAPFQANGGKRMYGAELLLRHAKGKRFSGWISYTMARCVEYDFDVHKYIVFDKDQTHNCIVVGTWFLPMQWNIGFKFQATSGDPETPLIGYEYDEKLHYNSLIFGERNSSRIKPSITLDLRVDKKFVFKNWMCAGYLDFFNIGYFLYKSPQSTLFNVIDVNRPIDPATHKQNKQYMNLYWLPAFGLKAEFY